MDNDDKIKQALSLRKEIQKLEDESRHIEARILHLKTNLRSVCAHAKVNTIEVSLNNGDTWSKSDSLSQHICANCGEVLKSEVIEGRDRG